MCCARHTTAQAASQASPWTACSTSSGLADNARGQRALIAYGNGVMTRYAYDPHTSRLSRLRSERYTQTEATTFSPAGSVLQDYGYDYDLAANLIAIRDRAPGSGIPPNPDA